MAFRYKYNDEKERCTGVYVGNYEETAQLIYADLYSRIWDLLNDRDYFRKNRKHDVLYAARSAQHVFTIRGRTNCGNNGMFWPYMVTLFQKGRLAKYMEDMWHDPKAKDRCALIQITPYIFIRFASGFYGRHLEWDYGVYGMGHTLGTNRAMRYSRVHDENSFLAMPHELVFTSIPSELFISVLPGNKFRIIFTGVGDVEVSWYRFNMRIHRFMKYFQQIRYLLTHPSRPISARSARSDLFITVENYVNGSVSCYRRANANHKGN